MTDTLVRNWGWVVLRGVIAVVFGIVTVINPGITLATLLLLFGAYALVDGIFMVFSALAKRRGEPRWLTLLVGGLLGIGAGVLTFTYPGLTAALLLALIASWAVVVGVFEIAAAIRLRREITGEWMFILSGLMAVAFGMLLVVAPVASAVALAFWIGAYAIVSGLVLIALGVRLRSWERDHRVHGRARARHA